MAKQQRASSRSDRVKPADASVSQDSRMVQRGRESQAMPTQVPAPVARPGHAEAVALYEEGVAALTVTTAFVTVAPSQVVPHGEAAAGQFPLRPGKAGRRVGFSRLPHGSARP